MKKIFERVEGDFFISKRFIDVINFDKKLSVIDRLVLIELLEHIETNEIAPTQKELAEILNVSDRSIRKSTKALHDEGWIRKELIRDECLQTQTRYYIGDHMVRVLKEVL